MAFIIQFNQDRSPSRSPRDCCSTWSPARAHCLQACSERLQTLRVQRSSPPAARGTRSVSWRVVAPAVPVPLLQWQLGFQLKCVGRGGGGGGGGGGGERGGRLWQRTVSISS